LKAGDVDTMAPGIARDIRAAVLGKPLGVSRLEALQAQLVTEADLQTAWVAIARRPELASEYARPIAEALIADPRVSTQQWMLDIAAYRGQWLQGGIVAVLWSAVGQYLSRAARGKGPGLGVMPKWPDLDHALEGGTTWRAELKAPPKMGKRGKLIGLKAPDLGQAATIKALNAAGHPAIWASDLVTLAVGLVEVVKANRTDSPRRG